MVRIALVSMHTSPLETPGHRDAGGMNVVIRALAHHMAAEGHDVEIVTRAQRFNEPAVIDCDGGVRVRNLRVGSQHDVHDKNSLVRLTRAFGDALSQLPRFDVVHAHYWLSGSAAESAARRWGAPLIHSFHTLSMMKNAHPVRPTQPNGSVDRSHDGEKSCSGTHSFDAYRYENETESPQRVHNEHHLIAHASRLIAATRSEKLALQDLYGASAEKIDIIPPGVDTQIFRPNAPLITSESHVDRFPSLPRRAFITVVGRVQPLKAQDIAIRALAHIPRPRRPALVLVGDTSPAHDDYMHALRALVRERDLDDDVFFVGAVSRETVAAIMNRATLTLVPSFSETYGLVALESAAVGTPVIARRTTGLTDSVVENVTGVFVDGSDPLVWAQQISRFFSSSGTAAHIGIDGQSAPDKELFSSLALSLEDRSMDGNTRVTSSASAVRYARSHTWGVAAHRHLATYRAAIRDFTAVKANKDGSEL